MSQTFKVYRYHLGLNRVILCDNLTFDSRPSVHYSLVEVGRVLVGVGRVTHILCGQLLCQKKKIIKLIDKTKREHKAPHKKR